MSREEVRARVGDLVSLNREGSDIPAALRSPSGPQLPIDRGPAEMVLVGGPLPEPGRYIVVDGAGHPIEALGFAATLEPAASDTSRVALEGLSGWFGEEEGELRTADPATAGRRTPAWTWLIVVAALAFFLEGVLLQRSLTQTVPGRSVQASRWAREIPGCRCSHGARDSRRPAGTQSVSCLRCDPDFHLTARRPSRIYRQLPPPKTRMGLAFLAASIPAAVAWMTRQGVEVYAYTANLAQPDERTPEDIPPVALRHGAVKARLVDCRE